MFDIGWSELLLIAVVAIIVVGPKDLPPMLRATGRMVSKLRRTAGEFQNQFNEALREAELDGVKDSINEIRADTELMRAAAGKAAIKGGADGVHIAILPEHGLGIALKIMDGSDKAREAAIASLLVRLGVIEAGHPAVIRRLQPEMRNWRGLVTGGLRISPEFQ